MITTSKPETKLRLRDFSVNPKVAKVEGAAALRRQG